MSKSDKQSQELAPETMESAFFGASHADDLDLTPEEILLRDGGDPVPVVASPTEAEDLAAAAAAEAAKAPVVETPAAVVPKVEPAAGETRTAEEIAAAVEADKAPAIMVPKARMDEALRRARAAEAQLKNAPVAPRPREGEAPFDITKLDLKVDTDKSKKMWDAVIDNQGDVADTLLSELLSDSLKGALGAILPSLRAELRSEISTEVYSGINTSTGANAFDTAVNEVYTEYPFMNPEHATFDKVVMDDAMVFMRGYEASGESSAAAVILATNKALALHRPDLLNAPAPTGGNVVPIAAAKPALVKNAAAAAAQPPSLSGATPNAAREAAEKTIDDLSDDEFDALPESKKAQMRGDFR